MYVNVLRSADGEDMELAIKAIRSSWCSYDKSDTKLDSYWWESDIDPKIGEKDKALMLKLIKAGPEHSKFLRMLPVFLEIKAPLYWWKQFDTYKVGTVTCSESTMHTLTHKPLELTDFEIYDTGSDEAIQVMQNLIDYINKLIDEYKISKGVNEFDAIIRLLPESYLQRRFVKTNYAVLANIVKQRKGHKLSEWDFFIDELKHDSWVLDEPWGCSERHYSINYPWLIFDDEE
jgi:hypothetical protein